MLNSILLQHSISTASLPGHPGGVRAPGALSPAAAAAAPLATAFGATFWVAVALIAAALVPALPPPRFGKLGSCDRLLP